MTESHKRVQISEIEIGDRFRQDFGDISALVDSIKELGLLQPIGVTEDNQLVFGERRLRAAKELGWSDIDVRIVNVSSLLQAEYDENEARKNFTLTERYALAEALKAEIGSRVGRPSKIPENFPELNESKNVLNCAPIPDGMKTRDYCAQKAGFSSKDTYARVGDVVENGTPALNHAMDTGDISASAASKVSKLPPEEQDNVVQLHGKERREAIKKLSHVESDESEENARIRQNIARLTHQMEEDVRNASPLMQITILGDAIKDISLLTITPREAFFKGTPIDQNHFDTYVEKALSFISELKEAVHDNQKTG